MKEATIKELMRSTNLAETELLLAETNNEKQQRHLESMQLRAR